MRAILQNYFRFRTRGQQVRQQSRTSLAITIAQAQARQTFARNRQPSPALATGRTRPRNKMIRDTERFLNDPASQAWPLALEGAKLAARV